jgi:mono/diheme cytochrome c family protein
MIPHDGANRRVRTMIDRISLTLGTAVLIVAAAGAQQSGDSTQKMITTGKAAEGKPLYLDFGCYACHGYNAQTGNGPRLLPPRLNQQQFVLYLRTPRTPQMPAYTQKVLSDLEAADIYAYVLSLPREPALKDVPLLNELPK